MLPLVVPSNQNLAVAGMVLVCPFCQQVCNPESIPVAVLQPQWSHCDFHGMLKNFCYEKVIGMFFFNSKETYRKVSESFLGVVNFFHSGWFFKN